VASTLQRIARSRAIPFVVVAIPFVVAAVRLASRHWMPVLDMAMTEIRVRDVGTGRTPLVGLPGRIGNFPDQGSHPGPLSFYLLAPGYRIFGSSGGALLVSACALVIACSAATLAIARRLGGPLVQLGVLAALLATLTGFGINVVTQPWNPYFPLLFWILAVVAAWAVLAGHHALLVVVVFAASVCAQTHISYLTLAVGICALVLATVAVRWRRATEAPDRRLAARSLGIAGAVGALLWSPVLIEQVTRPRGNLGYLQRHFATPGGDVIGFGTAGSLMLRHLDLAHFFTSSGSGGISVATDWPAGSPARGGLLLVLWVASVVAAVRIHHTRIVALDAVIAASFVLGWISASRIFGKIWFYLTLWGSVIGPLMVVAVVWTLWSIVGPRLRAPTVRSTRGVAYGALGSIVALTTVTMTVDAARLDPPDHRLSESLRAVVAPTVSALRRGEGPATGPDGDYVVMWNDAYYFGSQGYGLVNELELQGIDARSPDTWRVPLTRYRVREVADATAVVQFATGSFIPVWQAVDGAVEVANIDIRTPEEVAEFDRLRGALIGDLERLGLADLIEAVDTNLFGVQLDERTPDPQQRKVNRMLELGEPTAVFLLDPQLALAPG